MASQLLAFSAFIISYAQSQSLNPSTGRYPEKYNLIDADPSCRYDIPAGVCCVSSKSAQCPNLYTGAGDVDVMAIHPNILEREEYLKRNMARLYPEEYRLSIHGGFDAYAGGCDAWNGPGERTPYYFLSEAAQASRWNSYSGATVHSDCNRAQCITDGCPSMGGCIDAQTSHFTCCDYCPMNSWGQCGYKYRTKAMVQLLFAKNSWNDVGSEGIWSGNTAFCCSSAHCGQNFNYIYHHQGIGIYPGGAATMVGIKDTEPWEDHVFPHSYHTVSSTKNELRFWLEFYGGKKDPVSSADEVYLLFDDQTIAMDLFIGSAKSGFYNLSITDFTSWTCAPYAFIAKDTSGKWWRLPEDERFYFGLVDDASKLIDESAQCDENHYFYTGTQWVANGAYNLTNAKDAANGCAGCDKVDALENHYKCRSQNVGCNVFTTTTANDPTQMPSTKASDTSSVEPTQDPTDLIFVGPDVTVIETTPLVGDSQPSHCARIAVPVLFAYVLMFAACL